MTLPQQPQKPKNNANISGDPMDLDTLLDIANIDIADIESAAEWWDNNARREWVGALDSEPVEGDE